MFGHRFQSEKANKKRIIIINFESLILLILYKIIEKINLETAKGKKRYVIPLFFL